LLRDGGDCELVDVDEGIVKLRLLGACGTCPSSTITLKAGIERALIEEVPGILEVEQVFEYTLHNQRPPKCKYTLLLPSFSYILGGLFLLKYCIASFLGKPINHWKVRLLHTCYFKEIT